MFYIWLLPVNLQEQMARHLIAGCRDGYSYDL